MLTGILGGGHTQDIYIFKSKSRTKLSCCSTRPSNSVLFVAVWLWTAEDSRSTCDFFMRKRTYSCHLHFEATGRIITKVPPKSMAMMQPDWSDAKKVEGEIRQRENVLLKKAELTRMSQSCSILWIHPLIIAGNLEQNDSNCKNPFSLDKSTCSV